ncbi:hypothetical protein M8A51_11240 [Schlegelella sp. S2-27]|uniref:Lipoprotein n=1 Tax=Caldimonas mangrovi TaxID=2944811 RepID=A0ABT0YN20_9BURK|nr:hypothetical protein [Caldimonas mangrovi]MCM5680107.1 hypothetical protein [Caldimonas mangrovi]
MRALVTFVLCVALASQLSGCATADSRPLVDSTASKTFTLQKIEGGGKSQAELDAENEKQIEDRLQEVLNFCLPRLSGYEKASVDQAKRAYWLSMSGLVAGSVVAPALTAANATANATYIAAFSGWGGATNFAGQALRTSGLSGSTIAETRNGIIKNVREAIGIASDGTKTFEERRGALMRARSECIIYEIAVPSIPSSD